MKLFVFLLLGIVVLFVDGLSPCFFGVFLDCGDLHFLFVHGLAVGRRVQLRLE